MAPEEKPGSEERPPRPWEVWLLWPLLYVAAVLLFGLLLFKAADPDPSVFPPLLTALSALFVATAINVRPGAVEDDDEAGNWTNVQDHVVIVGVLSMICSVGLVMFAIAFPTDAMYRLAFWAAAFAILLGAGFLLVTAWVRIREPARSR